MFGPIDLLFVYIDWIDCIVHFLMFSNDEQAYCVRLEMLPCIYATVWQCHLSQWWRMYIICIHILVFVRARQRVCKCENKPILCAIIIIIIIIILIVWLGGLSCHRIVSHKYRIAIRWLSSRFGHTRLTLQVVPSMFFQMPYPNFHCSKSVLFKY